MDNTKSLEWEARRPRAKGDAGGFMKNGGKQDRTNKAKSHSHILQGEGLGW